MSISAMNLSPTPARPPARGKLKKGGAITSAIALILTAIYSVEGGFVDDKADRGGPTKYGVTQQVAREAGYRGNMRDFLKHLSLIHI